MDPFPSPTFLPSLNRNQHHPDIKHHTLNPGVFEEQYSTVSTTSVRLRPLQLITGWKEGICAEGTTPFSVEKTAEMISSLPRVR